MYGCIDHTTIPTWMIMIKNSLNDIRPLKKSHMTFCSNHDHL